MRHQMKLILWTVGISGDGSLLDEPLSITLHFVWVARGRQCPKQGFVLMTQMYDSRLVS